MSVFPQALEEAGAALNHRELAGPFSHDSILGDQVVKAAPKCLWRQCFETFGSERRMGMRWGQETLVRSTGSGLKFPGLETCLPFLEPV